jgi:hypothetical protein
MPLHDIEGSAETGLYDTKTLITAYRNFNIIHIISIAIAFIHGFIMS